MLTLPPRSDFRTRPIFTPRLMLAPLDGAAAREMHEAIMASRAELEPWLPWVPFTQDAPSSLQFAEASAHDWDSGRASRFAIRDRVTHVFLGITGIESWQSMHDSGDLGYWLKTSSRGHGYMTEAARATLHFAFEMAGAHRIRVAAATDNHLSLSVIHRLGFHFEGIARHAEFVSGRWLNHSVFGLLSTDIPR